MLSRCQKKCFQEGYANTCTICTLEENNTLSRTKMSLGKKNYLVEKSHWGKKLSACLLACLSAGSKEHFFIENIKLSFLVLSVSRVMVDGRGIAPPPQGQRNTLPGSKKHFELKKLRFFCSGCRKKSFSE